MAADTTAVGAPRRATGWIGLLVLFGIASTIEAATVSHVFRFLPLYLGTVQVPLADVPTWTGFLNSAFFLFGLPLVPLWGVWAQRSGRIPIITCCASAELLDFAHSVLAQHPPEPAFALSLVACQLVNT